MTPYSLSRMAATKTKRPTITLPPIQDSIGARKEYERALRAMLRSLAATVRSDVLPAAEAEIARQRSAMTQDALGEFVFQSLKDLAVRLGVIAEGMVGRILRLESERHTKKWLASVRSTIGIDLAAVVSQEDLADYLTTAAARNASLIKSLGDDAVKRVEQATYQAVLQGQTADQLRKTLTESFGIVDRRAKIIARDQIATLTSDLNRVRHQQAGIEEYYWSTSADERVRSLHRALSGNRYEYGKPTGAEGGLPPGGPILCRCVARAIVTIGGEEFTSKPSEKLPERFANPSEELTPEAMRRARANEREHQKLRAAGVGQQAGSTQTPLQAPVTPAAPNVRRRPPVAPRTVAPAQTPTQVRPAPIPPPPTTPSPRRDPDFVSTRVRNDAPSPIGKVAYSRQLSAEEIVAVRGYKQENSLAINRLLTDGKLGPNENEQYYRTRLGRMDAAMSTAKLKEDLTLYRGLSDRNLLGLDTGAEFNVPAFQSSSTSRDVATRFAVDGYGKDAPVLMRINARAGQRGIDADRFVDNYVRGEKEVILDRDATMRVTGRSKLTGVNQMGATVDVEVLEVEIVNGG